MKTIKRIAFSVMGLIACLQTAVAQEKTAKDYYYQAYSEITDMLEGKAPLSIRRAVLLAEWDVELTAQQYQPTFWIKEHFAIKEMQNGMDGAWVITTQAPHKKRPI